MKRKREKAPSFGQSKHRQARVLKFQGKHRGTQLIPCGTCGHSKTHHNPGCPCGCEQFGG